MATAAFASPEGCSSSPTSTLTGFGPYYGDAWSDLEQFEASIALARDEVAEHYVTFHHKGVIEGREQFVELIDGFAEVIPRRHAAMLEFLTEPRTVEEMVAHRFVYRPRGRVAVRRPCRGPNRRAAPRPDAGAR